MWTFILNLLKFIIFSCNSVFICIAIALFVSHLILLNSLFQFCNFFHFLILLLTRIIKYRFVYFFKGQVRSFLLIKCVSI